MQPVDSCDQWTRGLPQDIVAGASTASDQRCLGQLIAFQSAGRGNRIPLSVDRRRTADSAARWTSAGGAHSSDWKKTSDPQIDSGTVKKHII